MHRTRRFVDRFNVDNKIVAIISIQLSDTRIGVLQLLHWDLHWVSSTSMGLPVELREIGYITFASHSAPLATPYPLAPHDIAPLVSCNGAQRRKWDAITDNPETRKCARS